MVLEIYIVLIKIVWVINVFYKGYEWILLERFNKEYEPI